MKIKIVQFDNRTDGFPKLSKYINQKYCEINGYDYEFELFNYDEKKYKDVTQFAIKNKKFVGITYHKYELIEKFIKNYDYVIFIDSDCVFVNPYKKIEEIIDNTHQFFISIDFTPIAFRIFLLGVANKYINFCQQNQLNYIDDIYETGKHSLVFNDSDCTMVELLGKIVANPHAINSGFMIFKNTPLIYDFIKDLKKFHKIYFCAQEDQGCIGHLLTTDKYKDMFKIFPKSFQGNSITQFNDFKYDENISYINHMTGGTSQQRQDAMKLVMNNKWWKKIFKDNIQ